MDNEWNWFVDYVKNKFSKNQYSAYNSEKLKEGKSSA